MRSTKQDVSDVIPLCCAGLLAGRRIIRETEEERNWWWLAVSTLAQPSVVQPAWQPRHTWRPILGQRTVQTSLASLHTDNQTFHTR